MSRSWKHNPVSGFTTAKSEKDDKVIINKKLRRTRRQLLKNPDLEVLETAIFPVKQEVMDIWSMAKDGKTYYTSKYQDKDWYEKVWRK